MARINLRFLIFPVIWTVVFIVLLQIITDFTSSVVMLLMVVTIGAFVSLYKSAQGVAKLYTLPIWFVLFYLVYQVWSAPGCFLYR
ncbi:MAG: hypothetical protein JW888_11395 [Pirellulales bacterium]|nr:hypothetical protein [Pirellulales bacterium]